jgi:hypothetical protein
MLKQVLGLKNLYSPADSIVHSEQLYLVRANMVWASDVDLTLICSPGMRVFVRDARFLWVTIIVWKTVCVHHHHVASWCWKCVSL